MDIKITKTTSPAKKPDGKSLGFGKIFTDHMFCMNYTEGQGWHDARIEPFHDLTLSPACVVFHYGQEMFEGLKAYEGVDGKVRLELWVKVRDHWTEDTGFLHELEMNSLGGIVNGPSAGK